MAWVEGSPEEITAKLALLSDKLGHRLLEIRERAIASLNFKLSNDLMTFEDVGSDSGVLRALLDWFDEAHRLKRTSLSEPAPSTRSMVGEADDS